MLGLPNRMINLQTVWTKGRVRLGVSLMALSLLTACGGGKSQQKLTSVQSQLRAQIAMSCAAPLREFRKEVSALDEPDAVPEQKQWATFPTVILGETEAGNDSFACQLVQELEYALNFPYEDPFIRDLFTVEEKGDTTLVRLQEAEWDESALKRQEIVRPSQTGPIRYLHSFIDRENWLYHLSVDIEVWFDATGRYVHHQLNVDHTVSFVGSDIHAQLKGQALYADE